MTLRNFCDSLPEGSLAFELSIVRRLQFRSIPHPPPSNNRQRNTATNKDARDFLAREQVELLFLRLPRPSRRQARGSSWAWREVWVRGSDEFWDDFERSREGRLGSRAEARRQYLDRKSTRLNSSHRCISYAVFCLKKKQK